MYCIYLYTVIIVSILVDISETNSPFAPFLFLSLYLISKKKDLRKSAAIVNMNYKLCKKVHRNILLVNDFLAPSFFFILCSISLLKSNCFTL